MDEPSICADSRPLASHPREVLERWLGEELPADVEAARRVVATRGRERWAEELLQRWEEL